MRPSRLPALGARALTAPGVCFWAARRTSELSEERWTPPAQVFLKGFWLACHLPGGYLPVMETYVNSGLQMFLTNAPGKRLLSQARPSNQVK